MEEVCRNGTENAEEKREKGLEIADQNIDVDTPEERPGVGYEIFTIGTGE